MYIYTQYIYICIPYWLFPIGYSLWLCCAEVSVPDELPNLQHSVLTALFELPSSATLFSLETGGDSVAMTHW